MIDDISLIKSIQIEVSTDTKNFTLHREISGEDLIKSFSYLPSTLGFFSGLLETGRNICKDGNYANFRLKVSLINDAFYINDVVSEFQKTNLDIVNASIPDDEYLRYEALTKREKQILCFLYRGYNQDSIAYIFGLTVHSIKKHRYNIYKKAKFRNRTDLAVWCEKFLQSVFKLSN